MITLSILVEHDWMYKLLIVGKDCEAKKVVTTNSECKAAAEEINRHPRQLQVILWKK